MIIMINQRSLHIVNLRENFNSNLIVRHRKWVNNDAKNFSFRSYENLEHCARLNNNLVAGFLSSSHFVVYAIHFAN